MSDADDRLPILKLVEGTIQRWREGETPDAAGFLRHHPEIGSRKSLALDLIHEELCLRKETGVTIVPSTFIERFPDWHRSIARMLEVEQYGQQHPELLEFLTENHWPRAGQEYLGFEVIEPLGRGALARVYLARELAMGRRPVVIKVAPQGGNEAHLLGKLGHGNIVAAHSVRHDDSTGMTVICMPLLGTATGLDLLDQAFLTPTAPTSAEVILRVARRYQPAGLVKPESLAEEFPFSQRTYVEGIAWLGQQLATGLAAAHAIGVVHRDIKPSNVLLAWSGRPMLLDFNLSTDLDDQADRLGGTLAYMAPERIYALLIGKGVQESVVDPRADIFSLGTVLYELLTGRLPAIPADAEANNEAAMRRWLAVRGESISPASRYNRQVDPAIDQILLQCLAPKPDQRFASATELAQALASYLGPRATGARWLLRNRRKVLAGGIAAVCLSAAGINWWSRLPTMPEHYYRRGLELFDQGKYGEAIGALTRTLTSEPENVPALFARGQSHYRLGDMTSAQRDFLAAAAREDRSLFWFCAGCCGVSKGDGTGLEYLGKALAKGYDQASVSYRLGLLHYYDAKGGRAIANFTTALEADPSLQPAYYYRALIRLNQLKDAGSPILPLILADAEKSLETGPPCRTFTRVAAEAYLRAAGRGPSYAARARELVELLISQGEPVEGLGGDPIFGSFLDSLADEDPLKVAPAGVKPVSGAIPAVCDLPATADLSAVSG